MEDVPMREPFTSFPHAVGEWRGHDTPRLSAEVERVLGADDYLSRRYETPESTVGVFVAYYKSQRQGDSMHSPLNCLPGAGWQPIAKSYLPITVTDASGKTSDIEVNRYIIEKGLDQQVVLYWYQSHGRVIANEYRSKFFLVYDSARENRSDAALVRVTSARRRLNETHAEAEARAVAFVKAVFPTLGKFLPS
jgi:EpsI family protein